MIQVKILSFGSSWWARFGPDANDAYRFTRHAAYFNSTGLRSGGNTVRRFWVLPGMLRFNGVGDFNPHFPNRSVGATFECAELNFALAGTRLLFIRKARNAPLPDYYLLVFASERSGAFDFHTPEWKSDTVIPVAISQYKDRSEVLCLMRPDAWVRTSLGRWRLSLGDATDSAELRLED